MESHMMEWLNIVVRLMHITFGIAWIGASFYFVFLENALNRTENVRDELAGNLWAVHGGGFYYVEKYKVAPENIPKHLHWFKYEAYFTWLSGFCLLFVVYYFNASALLI
ncbi:MAG: urate hydroxylase PuuD, partial [Burkholderiales bacterium]|nr:urate hydroxylase PuuD [Flavobacterium sp.]